MNFSAMGIPAARNLSEEFHPVPDAPRNAVKIEEPKRLFGQVARLGGAVAGRMHTPSGQLVGRTGQVVGRLEDRRGIDGLERPASG
jgi:hypothetical protein